MLEEARSRTKLVTAGFVSKGLANAVGVGNKAGLFGYHTYTDSSPHSYDAQSRRNEFRMGHPKLSHGEGT